MSSVAIALGAWKRYAAPLLLATLVACVPFALVALSIDVPADRAAAVKLVRFAWVFGACAWMVRIVLVGAIAEAARAVAGDLPVSQLTMVLGGLHGLVRAVLPCAVAIAAVVIGSVALVVPGLLLFVLLAMTGASTQRGLAAPLQDSIEVARGRLAKVAIVAGAMVVIDLAIVGVVYLVFAIDLPPKPTQAQLAVVPGLIRVVAIGLAAATPVAATALGALFVGARR